MGSNALYGIQDVSSTIGIVNLKL